MLAVDAIPDRFWRVPYDGERYPSAHGAISIEGGANCQLFAYALLAHFGIVVPPLRSSELWADTESTIPIAAPFEPLDLLLFNRTADAYGAHVAVALGNDRAVHLSRRVGRPAVWPIEEFLAQRDYAVLIGGKRVIRTN